MKVELIIPIERLRGKLRQDGYYFRQYRGQQIHVKVTLTEVGIVEYVVLDAKKHIIYPRRVLS